MERGPYGIAGFLGWLLIDRLAHREPKLEPAANYG
jgi:hypothetical protein